MSDSLVKEVVAKVFPFGTKIDWNPDRAKMEDRFYIIPGQNEPRWIIPANPVHGITFLRQWFPYKWSSRFKWKALMMAYQAGQLDKIPGVSSFAIERINPDGWMHLGWMHPERPSPIIYVGTPGPARKAVVGLYNIDKGILSTIAKVPLTLFAKDSILHEADILKQLESQKPDLAPHTVFVDASSGISVQKVVAGRVSSRRLNKDHISYLLKMVQPDQVTNLHNAAEEIKRQIESTHDLDFETRETLSWIVCDHRFDESLFFPAVRIHGDFAPWNIMLMQNGNFLAIDWENSSARGLPLFDLIYFRSMQAYLFNEQKVFSQSDVHLFLQYMSLLGIPEGLLHQLTELCLAEILLQSHKRKNLEMSRYFNKLIYMRKCELCL